MLRRIARTVKTYADTTRKLIEYESRIVLLEQQRDKLAELLTESRRADPAQSELQNRLKIILARWGQIPDGDTPTLGLVDAVEDRLRALVEAEDSALDLGQQAGYGAQSSPELVDAVLHDLGEARERQRMDRDEIRRMDALVSYRMEVQARADELREQYRSKRGIRSQLEALHKVAMAPIKDFYGNRDAS